MRERSYWSEKDPMTATDVYARCSGCLDEMSQSLNLKFSENPQNNPTSPFALGCHSDVLYSQRNARHPRLATDHTANQSQEPWPLAIQRGHRASLYDDAGRTAIGPGFTQPHAALRRMTHNPQHCFTLNLLARRESMQGARIRARYSRYVTLALRRRVLPSHLFFSSRARLA